MTQRLKRQQAADAVGMKDAEQRNEKFVADISQVQRGLTALESGVNQMDQNLNAQIVAGHNSTKLMISEMMASMRSDIADLRKAKGADSWDQGTSWGHDPVPPMPALDLS